MLLEKGKVMITKTICSGYETEHRSSRDEENIADIQERRVALWLVTDDQEQRSEYGKPSKKYLADFTRNYALY